MSVPNGFIKCVGEKAIGLNMFIGFGFDEVTKILL
jgi:hypothetical protein